MAMNVFKSTCMNTVEFTSNYMLLKYFNILTQMDELWKNNFNQLEKYRYIFI